MNLLAQLAWHWATAPVEPSPLERVVQTVWTASENARECAEFVCAVLPEQETEEP